MNNKLHEEEDYKVCKFTSVYKLVEEDDIDWNWSDPKLTCSGTPAATCQEIANTIASQAQQLFSIK